MKFSFLKDETEELIELINKVFNKNGKKESFVLQDNQRFLLLKDNDKVIGATMITVKSDPIEGIKTFYLDYVCLSEEYRHMGLGEKMFNEVEKIAKKEKINKIELASNPKREAARKLYQKEGMKIKETDLFIKDL